MNESDVANAKERYLTIRSEIEKEVRDFELLKRQHERRVSQLNDEVIKAWSAYHSKRIDAELQKRHSAYHSTRIDAELKKRHAASAIDFIKTSMEEQQ